MTDLERFSVRVSSRGGEAGGAGILLSRSYAVTAAHCVESVGENEQVDVTVGGGSESVSATLLCKRDLLDLALLELAVPATVLQNPVPTSCAPNDPWWSPYRPDRSHGHIGGSVRVPSTEFENDRGGLVTVAELINGSDWGDFTGYSGSAACKGTYDADEGVLGMLIEQLPDRADAARATTTLFATTIRFVHDSFPNVFSDRALRDSIDGVEYAQDFRDAAAKGRLPADLRLTGAHLEQTDRLLGELLQDPGKVDELNREIHAFNGTLMRILYGKGGDPRG